MAKLTNEQLAEIGQKAESLSEDMPFYSWDATQLLNNDIPALLDMIAELQAEVERVREELRKHKSKNVN